MKLTVFGATCGVGREVVTQALDAGHHVTTYVRNPAKLDLTHPELTVTAGETTRPSRLPLSRGSHRLGVAIPT